MTAAASSQPSVALGALLISSAFACVAVMSACGKAATELSMGTIVFFQSSINLVLLSPWAVRKRTPTLRTSHLALHAVRATAGVLSQCFMFIAVKMQLANAVLLANSAPLFIPLIAWIWLRQRVTWIVWLSVVLGFVGVLLILRPSRALLAEPAALIAVAAGVSSALALVAVRRLSSTEPGLRVLFYYFLFSSVAAAPFAVSAWAAPSRRGWLLLGGIGAMMALSQMLIVLAYRYATATRIPPFNYVVVLFSGLIGWAIWHEVPAPLAVAGSVLVISGGVLSMAFGGDAARMHQGSVGAAKHFFHPAVAA